MMKPRLLLSISFSIILLGFVRITAFAADGESTGDGASPQPADSSTEPPAQSLAVPTRMLPIIGRIEATATEDATLPERLTKLQAEIPKLDTTDRKPLLGNVAVSGVDDEPSFPSYILGRWGGQLTITSIFSTNPMSNEPDRVKGKAGLAIFSFAQQGSAVVLKPTTVFLPPSHRRIADCSFAPRELDRMKREAREKGVEIDPNQVIPRNPQILFGAHYDVKLDGSDEQVQITANNLTQLADDVVEQDIVTRRESNSASGRNLVTYNESIIQFRKLDTNTEFVRAAKISYGRNRQMNHRLVIEGTITRDWQSIADKIAAQLNRPWSDIEKAHDL